jgi:tetratricopeptide (TPR) repeat protein
VSGTGLLEGLEADVDAARELFQHGRPADSLGALKVVRRQLERDVVPSAASLHLLAKVLISMASASFEVHGDLAAATGLLDQAESTALEVEPGPLLAAVRGQRGLLLLRSGRTEQAIAALDLAAEALDGADPKDQKSILVNRGVLHLERGELDAARADFEACLRIAQQTDDPVRVSIARHNLGWIDFLLGRLPRALALMAEAAAPHPIARLDRARVLREAGLVDDADALLEDVAAALRETGLWQDLGETELARAECAMVRGELGAARSLARSARRRFDRRDNVRWVRKADVLLLQCERAGVSGPPGEARNRALRRVSAQATELAERCTAERRRDLAAVSGLIAAESGLREALDSGDATDAPPAPRVRRRDPLATRLLTREVRALTARVRGDRRRALSEVRRGLAELGSYQHSFGSLDLRTASAVHGSALARLGLELVMRDGTPAEVLAFVERARAVSTRLPQVRPPDDPVTADLVAQLRRLEETTRALEGDPAAGDVLDRLRRRALGVQREVRARAWEIEGEDGRLEAPPRAGRLGRAAAESEAVFVTFARHEGRWVAVVADGRRARLARLGGVAEVRGLVSRVRGDLDALASPAVPEAMRTAVRHSLDVGLRALDAALLGPLELEGRGMVASCSGDLLFLPWGLLPSRSGTPTTVTPSAAAWLRGHGQARPDRPAVAVVAGPDLRLAEDEARRVAACWPGSTVLSGDAATSSATCEALVSHDLVHVSAHGRHRADSPLFSSVRLADGPLYAHEVSPETGLAGCVVLSACDAGLATTRPGEEILGLAQVLLQLGARNVVAAVARVNDEVSAGFMAHLQGMVSQGLDVSTSLAVATRETLDGASPAAFVSFGGSW